MVVETQASPLQDGGPGDSKPKMVDKVVVRFAGDSGDGMQITGAFFTHNSALAGNDISTLPDFPAEIRAPAGTLPGVSGFQLNFSSLQIMTPGDTPEVLVAMNPAALKVNLRDLVRGGTIILNSDTFRKNNLKKAGYEEDPRETGDLEGYDVHASLSPASPSRRSRIPVSATSLPGAARTCSPSASCCGCTTAPLRRPSA